MVETPALPPQQNITITTNLLTAPLYAEQLGHLCVAWSNLEWHMFLLFQFICGAPPAVARTTFYAIESNRGRREILKSVGGAVLSKQSHRDALDDILRRIGKTASVRNKYVHDTWGVAATQKHEIFQMRLSNPQTFQDMEEVTVSDLKTCCENIQKVTEALNDFREKVHPSLESSLRTLREQPGIALQFAKKGSHPGQKPKGHRRQR